MCAWCAQGKINQQMWQKGNVKCVLGERVSEMRSERQFRPDAKGRLV